MRSADLNRDTVSPQPIQTLAPLATEISSVDVLHAREFIGGCFTAGADSETHEASWLSSQDDEWLLLSERVRDF